jgi:hypothetical protein
MLRLSGAVTMAGIEQIQRAVAAPLDTRATLTRLCNTLDAMSDTLVAKLDVSNRATLDHMSRAQYAVLDRTIDMVDPERAGEFVRRTSEAFSSAMVRPAGHKADAA